jgi:fructosamine-3-kinase
VNQATRAAIEQALGVAVTRLEAVGGGDINEARRLTLADGRRAFAKYNPEAPSGLFEAEAHGLDWLAEARALAVPRVLGVGSGSHAFLLLEWIEPGARCPDFDERLGRGLAALHRAGAPRFGLARDNFIGLLAQDNRPQADWAAFYRERRLAPLVRLAVERGAADAELARAFERLFARLDELTGPPEPPARLHGDLWGGNLHASAAGEPVLIDPAAYGGHREIDLAMMRLFGGFGERVFAAYAESFPLAPGASDRIAVYQLYPLLVHLCLFGVGYLGQVRRALERYL